MKTIIIVLFLLSGCVSAYEQNLMKTAFPYYEEDVKDAIEYNYVIEGMTMEQVYLSLGNTMCKSRSQYKGSYTEVWSYMPDGLTGRPMAGTFKCYAANMRVYFENDLVVGWDNIRPSRKKMK